MDSALQDKAMSNCFLFSVTSAHVKKLGALNHFIQKSVHQSFLFIIGEKNMFPHISLLKLKDFKEYGLNKLNALTVPNPEYIWGYHLLVEL